MRHWFLKLLEKDSPHFFEVVLLFFLSLLSFIYSLLIRLRFFLYQAHLLKQESLSVPVVSVGNLNLGGTGKTPMVEFLSRLFIQRGKKVGILSRGYARKTNSSGIEKVEFDSSRSLRSQAEQWGDEPLLLSKHLPEVPIYVSKNRVAAGKEMLEKENVDLILLDDGFQHFRLKRDVDLVLLDPEKDLKGKVFPRGLLREPLSSLKRASLFCSKDKAVEGFVPASFFQIKPVSFIELVSGKKESVDFLKGKSVLLFSGIGRPQSFEQTCRHLGLVIKESVSFPDHHYFSVADQNELSQKALQHKVDCLVTTEKDAMRWEVLKDFSLPVYIVQISLVSEGLEKEPILSQL